MFNNIKAELYRVFKSKMVYVFMGISALLPVLSLVFIRLFSEEAMASGVMMLEMNHGVFFSENAKEFLTGGLGILFALLLGIAILAEEYQVGMLKIKLLVTERLPIYVGKSITLFLSLGLVVCVHVVVAFVLGGIYYGFGMGLEAFFSGLLGYVLSYLTIAIASVCFMGMGLVFKKSSSAIGVGIGILLVWSVLMNLLSDKWLWLLPHGYAIKALVFGFDQYGYHVLLTLSGYLIIGFLSGLVYFNRKDLTL